MLISVCRAHAAGGGTTHTEVTLKQMLSYAECQQTYAAAEMALFKQYLANRDLAGAHALMAAGTEFAKCMRRASMFAAVGTAKQVPKQEPCRVMLNECLKTYEEMSGVSERMCWAAP